LSAELLLQPYFRVNFRPHANALQLASLQRWRGDPPYTQAASDSRDEFDPFADGSRGTPPRNMNALLFPVLTVVFI
jgi:hypothetical protein